MAQVPDPLDQPARLLVAARPRESQQAAKLVFQFGAAEGIARVALGFVDAPVQGSALHRGHRYPAQPALRIGTVDFLVQLHAHLVAKVADARIGQGMLMKFGQPGLAINGDQAQHGAHGELGLVHTLRHLYATQYIDGALMHPGGDAGNVCCTQALALHQCQQRIGRRVGVAARGVKLE